MPISTTATLTANTAETISLAQDVERNFVEVTTDGTAAVDFIVVSAGGNTQPSSVGVATFTDATDTWNLTAHGLAVGDVIQFSTAGTNPTTYATGTDYFVIAVPNADDFQLSATRGGAVLQGAGLDSDGTWTAEQHFVVVGDIDQWKLPATANATRSVRVYGNGQAVDVGAISSGTPTLTVTSIADTREALTI